MKCERCGREYHEDYRRDKRTPSRFCSPSCSKANNTKRLRLNRICGCCGTSIRNDNKTGLCIACYKKQVGAWNKGITCPDDLKKFASRHGMEKAILTTVLAVSRRTSLKILDRMKIGCSRCGWFIDGVACDLHHITPRSKGGTDEHTNLSYLCPNCHRMVHSGLIASGELVSLHDQVGEAWQDHYYG